MLRVDVVSLGWIGVQVEELVVAGDGVVVKFEVSATNCASDVGFFEGVVGFREDGPVAERGWLGVGVSLPTLGQ